MARKSLLVAVDIQEAFLGENPILPIVNENKNQFLNEISTLIDTWQANKNDVIYVQSVYGKWSILNLFTKSAVRVGSRGIPLVDSAYREGCPIFEKNSINIFSNKDFEKYLRDGQFKDVYFCGLFAEYCVNKAVTTAKKKGFNVSIVRDLIGFQKKEKFTSLLRKWEKSGINIIEKKKIVA